MGVRWLGGGAQTVEQARRSRAGRARRRRAPLVALACVLGLGAVGYGVLRFVPPVHQLALETVVTSGHAKWAQLFASRAEVQRAWRLADGNPRVAVTKALHVTSTQGSRPPLQVESIEGPTWHGWLAIVRNPRDVHVLYSGLLGRYGEKVSAMAASAGASLAVNGGGFYDPLGKGNGGQPSGALIARGDLLHPPDSELVIGLTASGTLVAGHFTLAEIHSLDVTEAVAWRGPILVANGVGQITYGDGGWGYGPRTAIGQRRDGTILLVAIDGRQIQSLGASMREVQDLMLHYGAVTAVALDGGASTVMWQAGRGILNHPCSIYGERYVPDGFGVFLPTARAGGTR